MAFDLRKLHTLYQRLSVAKKDHSKIHYVLSNEQGSTVGQIVVSNQGGIAVEIDNFPSPKKYFSYDLPVATFEDFESDMSRCGLAVERLPF